MTFRTLTVLLALLGLATPATAQVSPDETDAKTIMKAVEGRTEGDKSKGVLSMVITDKSGRARKRVVKSRVLQFDGGKKQLMVFQSPADVAGTGLLSIDYDQGDKDDDQWLFLPSLHKSTRISSGEKSGSFMGTDFSYADMTSIDPDHYEYKILKQSEQVQGEDTWHIESRPITAKAKKETGYVKTHVWISKSKLLPIRIKAWVKEGKKLKYITFKDFKKVDGIWVAHTLIAKTKKGKVTESTTVMQFQSLSYNNADVSDDLFTQRQLEKGL